MKFNKFYVSAILGCATLLLTPSCANDDMSSLLPDDSKSQIRFAVAVTATGAPASRDGYDDKDQGQVVFHEPHTENGQPHETDLSNLMIIVYDTPLNMARDSRPGRVVKTLFVDNIGSTGQIVNNHYHDAKVFSSAGTETTIEKDVPIARTYEITYDDLQGFDQLFVGDPDRTYYAIALANVGNLADAAVAQAANSAVITTDMTVLQLRDYVYNGPLYKNSPLEATSYGGYYKIAYDNGGIKALSGCNQFAMAGINEITVTKPTVTETTAGADNHKVTTTTLDLTSKPMLVQRLAARVDISFGIQAVYSRAWNADGTWRWDQRWDPEVKDEGGNVITPGGWAVDENNDPIMVEGNTTHYVTDTKVYLGYKTPGGPQDGPKEDVPTIYSVSGGPNTLNVGDIYYPYDLDVWGHAGLYRFPIYDEAVYQATGKYRRLSNVLFYLEDIELLNVVSKGSYMFEHSSDPAIAILGNDGGWENNYPKNFINTVSTRSIDSQWWLANGDYAETDGHPSTDDIPLPVPLITNYHRWEGTGQFIRFSTIAYIGENTFNNPSDANNKYTTVRLSGYANIHESHFDDDETHGNDATAGSDHYLGNSQGNKVKMSITYKLRHSFGQANPAHRMCFGVVRNTVYRTFIQFFYTGSNIIAREWYYDGATGSYKDEAYNVNIYDHIIENPNGPDHD